MDADNSTATAAGSSDYSDGGAQQITVRFAEGFTASKVALWGALLLAAAAFAIARRRVPSRAWKVFLGCLGCLTLTLVQNSVYLLYAGAVDADWASQDIIYNVYTFWANVGNSAFLALLLVLATGYCVTRSDLGPYTGRVVGVPITVFTTGLVTDYIFFNLSTSETDAYELSELTQVEAIIWLFGSVINLSALLLAWIYTFDILQQEISTLDASQKALQGPQAARQSSEETPALGASGYALLNSSRAAPPPPEVEAPPPGETGETVADRLAYQLKRQLLSRFAYGVGAYLVATILVLMIPMFHPALATTIVVLQFVVYYCFMASLLVIYRPVEASPYLMVGLDEGDADNRGVDDLATELAFTHTSPRDEDEGNGGGPNSLSRGMGGGGAGGGRTSNSGGAGGGRTSNSGGAGGGRTSNSGGAGGGRTSNSGGAGSHSLPPSKPVTQRGSEQQGEAPHAQLDLFPREELRLQVQQQGKQQEQQQLLLFEVQDEDQQQQRQQEQPQARALHQAAPAVLQQQQRQQPGEPEEETDPLLLERYPTLEDVWAMITAQAEAERVERSSWGSMDGSPASGSGRTLSRMSPLKVDVAPGSTLDCLGLPDRGLRILTSPKQPPQQQQQQQQPKAVHLQEKQQPAWQQQQQDRAQPLVQAPTAVPSPPSSNDGRPVADTDSHHGANGAPLLPPGPARGLVHGHALGDHGAQLCSQQALKLQQRQALLQQQHGGHLPDVTYGRDVMC